MLSELGFLGFEGLTGFQKENYTEIHRGRHRVSQRKPTQHQPSPQAGMKKS